MKTSTESLLLLKDTHHHHIYQNTIPMLDLGSHRKRVLLLVSRTVNLINKVLLSRPSSTIKGQGVSLNGEEEDKQWKRIILRLQEQENPLLLPQMLLCLRLLYHVRV